MVVKQDGLVVDNAFAFVLGVRVNPSVIHVIFCSGNREGAVLMNLVKPLVVYISSVHDVKAACFKRYKVPNVYIMKAGIGEENKLRNRGF